jgi:type I restriction enzyme S subunit
MRQVRLGTVAKVNWGNTSITKESYRPAGYIAFSATGADGRLESYEHDEEGIVLSAIGARCGRCFYADGKWTAIKNTITITQNSRDVHIRYLYHCVNSEGIWPRKGGGQPFISLETARALPVPWPSFEEQKRIAAILDKADAIRRKREQAIKLAEEFLRALFLDMFGDPLINPRELRTTALGHHLTFLTSGSRGWAQHYSPSGARFVRSLDVRMNRLGSEDVVYVNPPIGAEAKRCRIQKDDVLLTITGSRIGRVAPVTIDLGQSYVSQHVAILRLDKKLIPEYLSAFLSLEHGGQMQIARSRYGQTKPGLNLQQIRDFVVPVPPLAGC